MSEKLIAFLAASSLLNPLAAIGAAFGCVLHIAINPELESGKKVSILISSWAIGFGCGLLYQDEKSFLVAISMSALGTSIAMMAQKMIRNGEDLPLWFKSIISIFKRQK